MRTAVEALAAVLAGTNSLHTNALDEVLALPSAKAAQIALRTQQVLAEETGVLNVADPLGGSWYVEALTDKLEAEAEAIFARIKDFGGDGTMTSGLLRGIEDGWFIGEIADSAFTYQVAFEKGEKRVVGVNVYRRRRRRARDPAGVARGRASSSARSSRRAAPARDQAAVDAALARMVRCRRDRPEHRAGDARRGACRGDARRDLQRVQADVGRVPRARPLLTRPVAAAPTSGQFCASVVNCDSTTEAELDH